MVSARMTLQVLGASEDDMVRKDVRIVLIPFPGLRQRTCLKSELAIVVLMSLQLVGCKANVAHASLYRC
jgi:hypothetical protein